MIVNGNDDKLTKHLIEDHNNDDNQKHDYLESTGVFGAKTELMSPDNDHSLIKSLKSVSANSNSNKPDRVVQTVIEEPFDEEYDEEEHKGERRSSLELNVDNA